MGRVWRAVDEMLDRLVAVKEMRIDGLDPEDTRTRRERTLREARATARIDHPHVVRVYDVVDEGEHLWIVMELVAGRSLERIMAEDGPLGPAETARIGLGLVAALRQVHARGVLHRDIKPGNVLVETEAARGRGRVVLTDFGIAAIQDAKALTMVGMLVGSPDYMAPERISGRPQGPPSDVWSLGATLCAALAGRSPFSRDTTLATLHAVLYEEPQLPPTAGPLHPILTALLQKDPSARPTLDTLESSLTPVASPPPTPTIPVPHPLLPPQPPPLAPTEGFSPTPPPSPEQTPGGDTETAAQNHGGRDPEPAARNLGQDLAAAAPPPPEGSAPTPHPAPERTGGPGAERAARAGAVPGQGPSGAGPRAPEGFASPPRPAREQTGGLGAGTSAGEGAAPGQGLAAVAQPPPEGFAPRPRPALEQTGGPGAGTAAGEGAGPGHSPVGGAPPEAVPSGAPDTPATAPTGAGVPAPEPGAVAEAPVPGPLGAGPEPGDPAAGPASGAPGAATASGVVAPAPPTPDAPRAPDPRLPNDVHDAIPTRRTPASGADHQAPAPIKRTPASEADHRPPAATSPPEAITTPPSTSPHPTARSSALHSPSPTPLPEPPSGRTTNPTPKPPGVSLLRPGSPLPVSETPAPALRPRRNRRRIAAAVAVTAVLAAAIVTGVLLNGTGSPGGDKAEAGPSASRAASSPTVEGTARPQSLPPGAHREAGGFAWATPEGWKRNVKTGAEVHYTAPDGSQELAAKSSLARGDLMDSWEKSEQDARQGADYRKIRLERTTFRDRPAVVWEYTFTLQGESWHARLLGFTEDGRAYQINTWYRPEAEEQALETYARVRDSFTVL
ncbi:protein kinase [Streptomyces nigra]|uniref:serine/threonine-protein kinase n=1 Tax=Streptomyces nigra TaxID=1827580 RepID=UPI0036A7B954